MLGSCWQRRSRAYCCHSWSYGWSKSHLTGPGWLSKWDRSLCQVSAAVRWSVRPGSVQFLCGAGGAGKVLFQVLFLVLSSSRTPSSLPVTADWMRLPRVRPAAPGALAELCGGCSPTAAPEPRTAARNGRQNTPNRQAQLLAVSVCLWLRVLVACCGLFLI